MSDAARPAWADDPRRQPETWLPMLRRVLGLADPVEERAAIILTAGDPVEVRLIVEPHAIHVEVPVVEWQGPHTPILTGERRTSVPTWDLDGSTAEAELAAAIEAARAERLARFRACGECGERNPPEWMHGETICSGCAQRKHGVVY